MCSSSIPGATGLAWDDHISNCMRDGYHATRHNHVQNVIRQEALKRGQPSCLDTMVKSTPPTLHTDLLFTHIPGRDALTALAIDISITNPMARTNITLTPAEEINTPLAAARVREAQKTAKYREACRSTAWTSGQSCSSPQAPLASRPRIFLQC
jgi:hypothetical protein